MSKAKPFNSVVTAATIFGLPLSRYDAHGLPSKEGPLLYAHDVVNLLEYLANMPATGRRNACRLLGERIARCQNL